jgi:hypothetical protein
MRRAQPPAPKPARKIRKLQLARKVVKRLAVRTSVRAGLVSWGLECPSRGIGC